jgi:hypothetical protein
MARRAADFTVFMESEEFGLETFDADGWKEAVRVMKDLYKGAKNQNDGVERKIGIFIPAGEVESDEPDLMSDDEE